jgi:hypothetical protein
VTFTSSGDEVLGLLTSRRRRIRTAILVLALLLVIVTSGVVGLRWHRSHPANNMAIVATDPADADVPWAPRSPASTKPQPGQPRFVAGVSHSGRYLVDQYGRPIFVHGDSPWSLAVDLNPSDAERYFANRRSYGVNAMIMSTLGARANGGPSDDGRTFDGLRPFRGNDVTAFNAAYWDRLHHLISLARDAGITIFLYAVDSWVLGESFRPANIEQCQMYGNAIARRMSDLPNLVWMAGGDYVPDTGDPAAGSDADRCINAVMRGVRATGDNRLFSIQLAAMNSTDNRYWRSRVDWNFVYTYSPAFVPLARATEESPRQPAVLGESNYEQENNQPDTPPTTSESLRRQALWTFTSAGVGMFYGSQDWNFHRGWQQRLDQPGIAQLSSIARTIDSLEWWRLRPDTAHTFLTTGIGDCSLGSVDVLQRDCATAAISDEGDLAAVYLPTGRRFAIDTRQLASHSVAEWVDPASGATFPTPLQSTYTTPGRNSDGGGDWVLLIRDLK